MATKILPTTDDVTYTRARRAETVDGTWYTIAADCRDYAGSHVLIVDGRTVATIWGKTDYDYTMSISGRGRIMANTVAELVATAERMIGGTL